MTFNAWLTLAILAATFATLVATKLSPVIASLGYSTWRQEGAGGLLERGVQTEGEDGWSVIKVKIEIMISNFSLFIVHF
jgi:hypothetical protein